MEIYHHGFTDHKALTGHGSIRKTRKKVMVAAAGLATGIALLLMLRR